MPEFPSLPAPNHSGCEYVSPSGAPGQRGCLGEWSWEMSYPG